MKFKANHISAISPHWGMGPKNVLEIDCDMSLHQVELLICELYEYHAKEEVDEMLQAIIDD